MTETVRNLTQAATDDDAKLIDYCRRSIKGLRKINRFGMNLSKPAGQVEKEIDAVYDEIRPLYAWAIKAKARTIEGCSAKAALFLLLDSDELPHSIARGLVSIVKFPRLVKA